MKKKEKGVLIQVQQLRLRKIAASDLEFVRALRNHPETRKFLGFGKRITAEQQKAWFKKSSKDPSKCYLVIDWDEGKCQQWRRIGLVRIHDIDFENRHMGVGADLDPVVRGQGLAKQIYPLIFVLGFEKWKMNRLWLSVLDFNERARALYLKVGFRETGVQRQAVRRGDAYSDYILMDILKSEYLVPKQT